MVTKPPWTTCQTLQGRRIRLHELQSQVLVLASEDVKRIEWRRPYPSAGKLWTGARIWVV